MSDWLARNSAAIADVAVRLANYDDRTAEHEALLAKLDPATRCIPWIDRDHQRRVAALWGESLPSSRVNEHGVFRKVERVELFRGRHVHVAARVVRTLSGHWLVGNDYRCGTSSGSCSPGVNTRRGYRSRDSALRAVAVNVSSWLLCEAAEERRVLSAAKREALKAANVLGERFRIQPEEL